MSSPFQKKFIGKSPMHQNFSLDDLKKSSAKEDKESLNNSRSGNVGAPGDPGTEINYNDPKRFAGDDEGMLKDDFEPQFAGDDGYEDQDLKKNSSPLDSYSNPGQVKYFSNKSDFKALQDSITGSVVGAKKKESDNADYKIMADSNTSDEEYNKLAIKHNKKTR